MKNQNVQEDKILEEAMLIRRITRASLGNCIVFLKIAYERFKDLSSTDLVEAARKYMDYLNERKRPSELNLIQSQLYGLMMAYL